MGNSHTADNTRIEYCLLCIICSNADTHKMTYFKHLQLLMKYGNIFLGNYTVFQSSSLLKNWKALR